VRQYVRKIRGLVLGASKHRGGVFAIRGGWYLLGKSWLNITDFAQESAGRRCYPGVLTDIVPVDRKNTDATHYSPLLIT
jgi:hypothetical protein